MNKEKSIFIAGHNGMVGSAILRELQNIGHESFLTRSHEELDLINQEQVRSFFQKEKPEEVYLAAAKVGGILANNNFPATFIYDNLMMQTNVIHEAFNAGVKKLLFLGSSCIYPKFSEQPITESSILSGPLEPTNEPYALAKIAGIKMCESYNRQYGSSHEVDYRSVMPTNLYGAGDNYHAENSHVIPSLIRRFHEAKISSDEVVKVWGTGKVHREFLFVDDLAKACVHIMNIDKSLYSKAITQMVSHINIGSGEEVSIGELANKIAKTVDFKGKISFDVSKPDGTPRKLMDNSKILSLGWRSNINLDKGLEMAYEDFINNHESLRQ
jgi:GDP-L-fucose synthase